MLVSQLTSRLASGISKLVRNFRRRMDMLHYSCSHFGLKISESEDCARKGNNHTIWSATYSASSAAWHLASLPRFLGFPCKREGPGHLGGPHSVSREATPWASGRLPDRQVKSLVPSHLRVQGASLV